MISIETQIACVEREIKMRQKVYAKQVDRGKMNPKTAERELMTMTAVLKTLNKVKEQS